MDTLHTCTHIVTLLGQHILVLKHEHDFGQSSGSELLHQECFSSEESPATAFLQLHMKYRSIYLEEDISANRDCSLEHLNRGASGQVCDLQRV